MTQKEKLAELAAQEAREGRELVLLALAEADDFLTSAEIGRLTGTTGYLAGKYLSTLVKEGKVRRAGSGAGKYLFAKIDNRGRTTVAEPKKEVIKEPERWLIAWMVRGKGYGEVVATKEAARTRVREIALEMPNQPLFYGRATSRVGNTITEIDI